MAKDSRDRFSTMMAFAEALNSSLAPAKSRDSGISWPSRPSPMGLPSPPRSSSIGRQVLWVFVSLLTATVLAIGAYWIMKR